MRVVERVEGHYETQDVEFGRVYRWQPERVMVECRCGKRETFKRSELLESVIKCECGMDHSADVREELVIGVLEEDEKTLHPWRYWRPPEGSGLPF
jgi:hypothetical protein